MADERPPEHPSPEGSEGTATSKSAPQKRGASRTLKLLPGGTEEGHPLSPTEARRARAAHERFEVTYTPSSLGVPTWTIRGGSGQSYHVIVPAFPDRQGAQCSCPDFLTRGLGTCKHLEATLAKAASDPPPGLGEGPCPTADAPTWEEIEHAQEEALKSLDGPSPVDPATLVVELRRVGRSLISRRSSVPSSGARWRGRSH